MSEDQFPPKDGAVLDYDPSSNQASAPSPPTPKSSTIAANFRRHDEFWLVDGNMILVANNNTAFRVYRGLIAAQSGIFEDMFAAASSTDNELFEECPLIPLSDSPQDLVHLLRVLLPKSRRIYHRTEERGFDEVFAVIRLAHKYDIKDVEEQALASLQENILSPRFVDIYQPRRFTRFKGLNPMIGVMNIVRLTNTPSLLPGGFYVCSHLGGRLLDGWKREDGMVEYLSTDDLRRCLEGHPVLAREAILLPGRVFAESEVEGCTTPERCQLSRQRRLLDLVKAQDRFAGRRALSISQNAIENMAAEEETGFMKICEVCRKELLKRDRRERWLLWKNLPEIFGIMVEGWGSLETEDEVEHAVVLGA